MRRPESINDLAMLGRSMNTALQNLRFSLKIVRQYHVHANRAAYLSLPEAGLLEKQPVNLKEVNSFRLQA